jgi:hypothetical protein
MMPSFLTQNNNQFLKLNQLHIILFPVQLFLSVVQWYCRRKVCIYLRDILQVINMTASIRSPYKTNPGFTSSARFCATRNFFTVTALYQSSGTGGLWPGFPDFRLQRLHDNHF